MLLLILALAGSGPVDAVVESVIDGNTIMVSRPGPDGKTATDLVRVAELDCPSVSTVKGQLARKRAQALWPAGTKIVLRPILSRFKADKKHRTTARVEWPNDEFLGAIVKDQICRPTKYLRH